jgi:putative oxidoreductase
MKLKLYLQPHALPPFPSLALLFLRLVVGAAFLFHGSMKISHPFSWMPGGSVPAPLQFLAAISEFGGGLALVLGLLVPLAMLGLACTMAVAVHMHMIVRGDPFVNFTGGPGYELPLVFFAIALVFLTLGPGRFSLDAWIFGHRGR